MTASAAQQRIQRAKHGATYWAIFQRMPAAPIVFGSHYGTVLDCAAECDTAHGHVWSSEALALARLDTLPTHYTSGARIEWEVGRVMHSSGGRYFDVIAHDVAQLRAGMTVNVGTISGGDYWQTIASIEKLEDVGPVRWPVYATTWTDSEPEAAPSLLGSRRTYDVVTLRY